MDRRGLILAALSLAAAGPALSQDRRRRGDRSEAGSGPPHMTIAFGSDPRQAYDVYDSDTRDGPLVMFVHGGGWSRGDRSMVNALPDYARRHGLTLASTDYRLAPQVSAREQATDVAAAVASLRASHPGRPLLLMGHSAGAHLVALVGIDPVYLGQHGLRPDALSGVVPIDGAGYDATQPRGSGPIGRALEARYEQAFGDQRADLSPTLRVRDGVAYPPFLIFHIERREDSREQSRTLADTLRRAGGQAAVVSAPGDSHRDINAEFGLPGDAEGERAARFITTGRL